MVRVMQLGQGIGIARKTDRPLVKCPVNASWIEPGLYCWIRYMERTSSGELRAPVFEELIRE